MLKEKCFMFCRYGEYGVGIPILLRSVISVYEEV